MATDKLRIIHANRRESRKHTRDKTTSRLKSFWSSFSSKIFSQIKPPVPIQSDNVGSSPPPKPPMPMQSDAQSPSLPFLLYSSSSEGGGKREGGLKTVWIFCLFFIVVIF